MVPAVEDITVFYVPLGQPVEEIITDKIGEILAVWAGKLLDCVPDIVGNWDLYCAVTWNTFFVWKVNAGDELLQVASFFGTPDGVIDVVNTA